MALLTLDGVTKSHWRGVTERPVLRGASLTVHAGDLVAVYGQRGAGKTTLLTLAAGFDDPDGGHVAFEGRDLAALSRRNLARLHRDRIAWVEATGSLSCELGPLDYVALPLYRRLGPGESRRRAFAALRRVGAEDCAHRSWDDLSDATRALVAVAQALAREPRLLIADEPTAGLGIVDRERVVGLLRAAAEDGGVGVLMAVPDMSAMVLAHEVRALSPARQHAPRGDRRGPGT
ncbi:MAG: ATP-binding cassette domain-containing protein, partial [Thermoleophilaceae bacterium]